MHFQHMTTNSITPTNDFSFCPIHLDIPTAGDTLCQKLLSTPIPFFDLSSKLSAPKVHMVNERHWTLQIDLLSRNRPHLGQTNFLGCNFDVVREHQKTQAMFAIKIKKFQVMNLCPIIFQQMLFECSFPEQAADGRPGRLNC